jgi:murein DD-endopeptidase MepM/ murein hydrolase activator NlpD
MGITGFIRKGAHTGVDFRGHNGDLVLAAAGGVVAAVDNAPKGAGLCVLLVHSCSDCTLTTFYTSYCHLERTKIQIGESVTRGQPIGNIGHSGLFSAGVDHVHLTMCSFACAFGTSDGNLSGTFDPMKYDAGCWEHSRDYTTRGQPVLTHPVACDGN